MIEENLNTVVTLVEKECLNLKTRVDFEHFKASISGPKGKLTEIMKLMSAVPKEDKPAVGKKINEAKQVIQKHFDTVLDQIEEAELLSRLGPPVDPLSGVPSLLFPLYQIREAGVLPRVEPNRPPKINNFSTNYTKLSF